MTYTRIATAEELQNLTEEETVALRDKLAKATVLVDPKTFGPYVLIDEVRYDIVPATDGN